MAPKPAAHRVGAFGVKRVVFSSVGPMSGAARRVLRKRLGSELDAVRDLIRKAEFFPGMGLADGAGAAGPGKDGRCSAAEPHPEAPMEVGGGSGEAKRRKVSPPLAVQGAEDQNSTAPPDERARLATRLASLAAALPDHVVAFLQNQRTGDADYRGNGSGAEADVQSMMKEGGALVQLKLLLDKFAPASALEKNHGRAAAPDASGGPSCLSQHPQDASDKTGGAVEREGDDASRRIQLRDIAEEYGELVGAIGVLLLSPLPRKLVDLAERDDEYVDICGDASPVVFPAVGICSSPSSSSSSGSAGASSSDSDSSSGSDENAESPPPPPVFPKEAARSPETEKVQTAEPEEVQHHQRAPAAPKVRPITSSSPPAPLVLPKESDIPAKPHHKLQQNQCAAPLMPLMPPKDHNGTSARPPAAAHGVEPEVPRDQRAVVTAINNSSPPAPAAAPNPSENGTSARAQLPAPPSPDVIAEQHQDPVTPPAADDPALTDLIVQAQEAVERRRREETSRAREQARRELLAVERAALPDERVRPQDMEALGIAAFEHVVSTVEERAARRPATTGENNGVRVAHAGCPTVMQFLGLFLKADDGGGGEEGEGEQLAPAGFAPGGGGADMDVEEGEIR